MFHVVVVLSLNAFSFPKLHSLHEFFGGICHPPPQGIQWSSPYLMILAASSASGFVQWRLAKIKTADASLIWNKKPPDFRIRRSRAIKVLILIFGENGSSYTKLHVVWTARSRVIKLWKFRIHFVQNLLLQVKFSKRCNSWSSCPKNTKLWVQTHLSTRMSIDLSPFLSEILI